MKNKNIESDSIDKNIETNLSPFNDSSNSISIDKTIVDENQLKMDLLQGPDERAQKQFSNKKLDDHNLRFELINNRVTTIKEEWERRANFVSEAPIAYEPKFREFFKSLGDLENWSDEERKRYPKPPIAPKIINKVIYQRFPPNVIKHIQSKNPYYKWFIREHKHYYFLGQDGILIMEKFIYDAVLLMNECKDESKSTKEFLFRHAAKFGTGFQLELFADYVKSI